MTIPARLADVDRSLLDLSGTAGTLLPVLRKRLETESGKPDSDAGQLEELRKAISELERAVGMVRWQPSGEKTGITHAGGSLAKSHSERPGHKYTSRKRGPDGEWVYEYDYADPGKKQVRVTCPRCEGTGSHSFNLRHGDMCYGCEGKGYKIMTVSQYHKHMKRIDDRVAKDIEERKASAGRAAHSQAIMARLLEHYRSTFERELQHVDPQYWQHHAVEHFRLELKRRGIKLKDTMVASLEPYLGLLDEMTAKSQAAPRLVLRKAKSGTRWVDTGKKVNGHSIYRDQSGREAERIYEDEGITHKYLDNGDTMFTRKVFRVIGADDDVTTCELCGKENLKKTVILIEEDSGQEYRYGSDCAARAMGWTQSEIERTAETEQNKREREDFDSRLKSHPLTDEIREIEEVIAGHRRRDLTWHDDHAYQAWRDTDEAQAMSARLGELYSQRQIAVQKELRDEENRKLQQRLATNMPQSWRKKLWMLPRPEMLQGIVGKLDAEAKKPGGAAFQAPEGFNRRHVSQLRVAGDGVEALDLKGEWKPVPDLWLDKVADAYRVPGPSAWAAVNHPIHNEAPPATPEPIAAQHPASNEQKPARAVKVKTKAGDEAGEQSMMFSQAPRGGSGRYTMPGSRDHLHAHRKVYLKRRDAGEIAGTKEDWLKHLTEGWTEEKDAHKIELLREYRHLEVEARGMEDGPDLVKTNARLAQLRTKLERLGHKV